MDFKYPRDAPRFHANWAYREIQFGALLTFAKNIDNTEYEIRNSYDPIIFRCRYISFHERGLFSYPILFLGLVLFWALKMLYPEEHAADLKKWIVKRLENTSVTSLCPEESNITDCISSCSSSDADADVLADYVLALLRHDGAAQDVRKLCETEIPDFLKEGKLQITSTVARTPPCARAN